VNFTPRAMANRVLSVYDSVLARTCVGVHSQIVGRK
jgi:hypothetical protein